MALRQPLPRVRFAQLQELLRELVREEEVAEELGARRVAVGADEAAEQVKVARVAEQVARAPVASLVDVLCQPADRVWLARRDEDVTDDAAPTARAGVADRLVDLRKRLDVVDERVDEQPLDELASAVEEVGALLARLGRRQRVEPDHDHAVRAELERRLDRRVEAGAAVEVPASVAGRLLDVDGRERDRDRRRGEYVVDA